MPVLTQIVAAVALVVVVAEFYIVFKTKRDREILERLNNMKGE